MKRTTAIPLLCVALLLPALVFAWVALINWLDEPMNPQVPTASRPGTVVLTSRGCCFWATDARITLVDGTGERWTLIAQDTVYEFDIFTCEDLPDAPGPLQVEVCFTSHYGEEKPVSLTVMTFADSAALAESGLLLCYGDGDLQVTTAGESTRTECLAAAGRGAAGFSGSSGQTTHPGGFRQKSCPHPIKWLAKPLYFLYTI